MDAGSASPAARAPAKYDLGYGGHGGHDGGFCIFALEDEVAETLWLF